LGHFAHNQSSSASIHRDPEQDKKTPLKWSLQKTSPPIETAVINFAGSHKTVVNAVAFKENVPAFIE